MILRDYQKACVDAIWANMDKHIVASLPTGSGKTPVIAELVRRCLEFPGTHILILTHKRELIRQNAKTLGEHLPISVDIGIYCAGLRSKEFRQVTVASVQSIIRADDLPKFEIIFVDEAHLVPKNETGQYHDLFAFLPDARIVGLTATPYRMDGGLLHEGKDRLFGTLVYEAKTGDLIKSGWLSPIRARAVASHADLAGVHLRGGEYKSDEMIAAMDHSEITNAAVRDVLAHAADRKSVLVFCAGVEHARHVEDTFRKAGIASIATVTQETSMRDRDDATARFRDGSLRMLLNVGVYTTGFDAPNVDCIVLLRATKSPGLYVQMLGRGLRKCDNKKDCLLLDYGGNIELHGPLDMITSKNTKKGDGEPVVKTCPECASIISAGYAACPECGFVFPKQEKEEPKHGIVASMLDPIAATIIRTLEVSDVDYCYHMGKDGKPDSMRVDYYIGLWDIISEWVCPLHQGFPRQKAQEWFARRGIVPMPKTIEECIRAANSAVYPGTIMVRKNGKYNEVISVSNWKRPAIQERENEEIEMGQLPF